MALDIKNERAGGRQSYSTSIRENGNQAREQAGEAVKQNFNSTSRSDAPRTQNSSNAEASAGRANTPAARQPNGAGEARQAERQGPREQRQAEQAHRESASHQYVNARAHASNLGKLITRAPQSQSQPDARDASARPQNPQLHGQHAGARPDQAAGRPLTPQQSDNSASRRQGHENPKPARQSAGQRGTPNRAGSETAKETANKKAGETREPAQPQQTNAAAQGQIAHAAASSGIRPESSELDAPRDWDGDDTDDAEGADHHSGSSRFAIGNRQRSTESRLGSLLGGSAGQDDGQGADSAGGSGLAVDSGSRVVSDPIPESDPELNVFVAGSDAEVELLNKSRLFRNYVAKLNEIARLDQSLSAEIRDMFRTTPLSERIEGEMEIALSRFISGTPYGEGISG